METIAIDIVLLPDDAMAMRSYEANARLLEQRKGPHEFHPMHCVPHASLAMAGIRSSAVLNVEAAVRKMSQRYDPLLLNARLSSHVIPNGSSVSEFTIDRTESIVSLHEDALAALAPHRVPDAPISSLRQPPEADLITLHWLNNFFEQSSHERFSPHITLGIGTLPESPDVLRFTARTIAVFQLGNYCTCRKLFSAYPLKAIRAS